MKNIKINNNILVVRLKESDEIILCKHRTDNNGGITNLVDVDGLLDNKEYDLFKDAEKYCVITDFTSLKKFFNKSLDKDGIKELNLLLQEKKYQRELDRICQKVKESVTAIGNAIARMEDPLYGYKTKEEL